jgi:hypothetical protein
MTMMAVAVDNKDAVAVADKVNDGDGAAEDGRGGWWWQRKCRRRRRMMAMAVTVGGGKEGSGRGGQ